MALDLRLVGARLDYSCVTGIRARLEVVGSDVRIRIDLPTWEWVEVAVPVESLAGELRLVVASEEINEQPLPTSTH